MWAICNNLVYIFRGFHVIFSSAVQSICALEMPVMAIYELEHTNKVKTVYQINSTAVVQKN